MRAIITLLAISIVFFGIQYSLCVNAEKIAIKLIPVYIILFFALLAALFYANVFEVSGYAANQILAVVLAIGIGVASVGDVLAWVAYKI